MDRTRIQYALSRAQDTKEFVISEGALQRAKEVFSRHFTGKKAFIVTDSVIFNAVAKEVYRDFRKEGLSFSEPFIFPGKPVLHAEYELSLELVSAMKETDAVPVAIGSGTINDLVKLASQMLSRPYLVIPTAASVDGYSSYGAAIVKDGFKQTIECKAPEVICADTLVLKDAPHAMTAAGYGDLAAKLIAGSDWIISNAITGDPIDPVAWDLVQTGLRDCVSLSGRLNEGEAIEAIFSGLAMTGFAMQITKSSRPVSGAEHLFSHIWEMENLEKDGVPVFHGAKVALGTLASACFTEEVFKRSLKDIDIEKRLAHWPSWEERASEVRDAFSNIPQAVPQLIEINRAKYKTKEEIRNHYRTAVKIWEELKTRVQRQLISSDELFSRFAEAGCPTNPTEINLTSERFFQTFRRAQMLRNRFTVLDLAFELGILEECIEAVKASGRFAIENDSGKRTSSGPAIQRE